MYLDLAVADGRAQVTFRNISRAQLNISGEEQMDAAAARIEMSRNEFFN